MRYTLTSTNQFVQAAGGNVYVWDVGGDLNYHRYSQETWRIVATIKNNNQPAANFTELEINGSVVSGAKLDELATNLDALQLLVNREGYSVVYYNNAGGKGFSVSSSLTWKVNEVYDWNHLGVPQVITWSWDRCSMNVSRGIVLDYHAEFAKQSKHEREQTNKILWELRTIISKHEGEAAEKIKEMDAKKRKIEELTAVIKKKDDEIAKIKSQHAKEIAEKIKDLDAAKSKIEELLVVIEKNEGEIVELKCQNNGSLSSISLTVISPPAVDGSSCGISTEEIVTTDSKDIRIALALKIENATLDDIVATLLKEKVQLTKQLEDARNGIDAKDQQIKQKVEELKAKNVEMIKKVAEMELKNKLMTESEKETQMKLKELICNMKGELEKKDKELKEKDKVIDEQATILECGKKLLDQREKAIKKKDRQIKKQNNKLNVKIEQLEKIKAKNEKLKIALSQFIIVDDDTDDDDEDDDDEDDDDEDECRRVL